MADYMRVRREDKKISVLLDNEFFKKLENI